MKKSSLYLDTTVPSAYFDFRTPERQKLTRAFWQYLTEREVFISEIVLAEIRDTPDDNMRSQMEELVEGFSVLKFDVEARNLAGEYIKNKIFPEKYRSDANHVAISVINGINYLVSWNFKHLVKVRTRYAVNLYNSLHGYLPLEIIVPPEL